MKWIRSRTGSLYNLERFNYVFVGSFPSEFLPTSKLEWFVFISPDDNPKNAIAVSKGYGTENDAQEIVDDLGAFLDTNRVLYRF